MSLDETNPEGFLQALRGYNLLTEEQVSQAQREREITGEPLRRILQKISGLNEVDILQAVAYHYSLDTIQLSVAEIPPDIIEKVPFELAKKLRIIPVQMDGRRMTVAVDDPTNFRSLDEARASIGFEIETVLATPDEIDAALDKYYGAGMDAVMANLSLDDIMSEIKADAAEEDEDLGADAAPIIKYVDYLIQTAYKARASDIHIEPRERKLIIRYRIDGVLHEQQSPPKKMQGAVLARLKLMAGCDLAEKRIPQDGRIKLRMMQQGKRKDIDLRFSALPSMYGEAIVMRILDKSGISLGLEQVGLLPETIETFQNIIRKPNGIFLVTGPTGSGKTTTLYAALNTLNTPDRKIITVEDPVEYQLDGINQMQVRHDIGLDFTKGLRALLRQSPDVILVEEMRDLETAEIGIRAALTGHLVFSTLHTNDAPSSVTRLIDMGINPFLVSSSVEAIMAQRLIRRICANCKAEGEVPDVILSDFGMTRDDVKGEVFFEGKGCAECNNTGYRGRTTIFELMLLDEDLRELILQNAPTTELRALARKKGMDTLREYGMKKIRLGQTTFLEVQRATPSEVAFASQK